MKNPLLYRSTRPESGREARKLLSPCWLFVPYRYGIIICMKKTLHIDEKLLSEAKLASGAATDTDTVRLGLEALVRHAAYDHLPALRGSHPKSTSIPLH